MSSAYDNPKSRRRGLGHWVPLAITLTAATVGLAAWMLTQRSDDSDSEDGTESPPEQDLDYDSANYSEHPPHGTSDSSPAHSRGLKEEGQPGSWSARVSGALGRTPSPQQFFDNAGKTVSAAVTATGAAITNTLAAIREEDKNAFSDHQTWPEEVDAKKREGFETRDGTRTRKTVAIIVSADSGLSDLDHGVFHEHASILSHIPKKIDYDRIRFFILIYAPGLKDHAAESTLTKPPPSMDSSFSKIDPADAMTPGSEKSPILTGSSNMNAAFNAIQTQASALVEKQTMLLPFTSSNGHVHILRHLQPDVIYLQESLSGDNGSVVNHIQTWMKHDICLVVGAEGGHGALADSESEGEGADITTQPLKWWQREDRVGRGRGVVVVDGMRVHDDWMRRVEGRE